MSSIAFACIFGGALFGVFLRNRLPGHHLRGDAKDVVRLGTGLIGTIAALVLGLLIASANGTYETQRSQVRLLTANIVLLDNILLQYGLETASARKLLREAVAISTLRIWSENRYNSGKGKPFAASEVSQSFYDEILKLLPQNETERRSLKARAVDTSIDLAKTRLLLFATVGGSIPMPFFVVLVSWLTIIFGSYSLFADNNTTTIVALGVFALSASASIFLILELSQPFTGLMTGHNRTLALHEMRGHNGSMLVAANLRHHHFRSRRHYEGRLSHRGLDVLGPISSRSIPPTPS
jgi:hypothetical protein